MNFRVVEGELMMRVSLIDNIFVTADTARTEAEFNANVVAALQALAAERFSHSASSAASAASE